MTHLPSGNHRAEPLPVDNWPHNHPPRCCCKILIGPVEVTPCPACLVHPGAVQVEPYSPPRYPLRRSVRILLGLGALVLIGWTCWAVYLLTEM